MTMINWVVVGIAVLVVAGLIVLVKKDAKRLSALRAKEKAQKEELRALKFRRKAVFLALRKEVEKTGRRFKIWPEAHGHFEGRSDSFSSGLHLGLRFEYDKLAVKLWRKTNERDVSRIEQKIRLTTHFEIKKLLCKGPYSYFIDEGLTLEEVEKMGLEVFARLVVEEIAEVYEIIWLQGSHFRDDLRYCYKEIKKQKDEIKSHVADFREEQARKYQKLVHSSAPLQPPAEV